MPLEETLEVGRKNSSLNIGVPKETSFQENRIALVPDDVAYLTANGHQVSVETDAGKNANFQDKDYSEAGANIVYSIEDVYKCEIILKISPPTEEEIALMKPRQTIISAIQLTNRYENVIKKLIEKRATAIAFNYIRDDEHVFPVVRSMSEIAGSASILIAGEYLSNVNKGMGLVLGGISGIPPTEVVIIGAGTVGEFSARAAMGLGATVKVFDNSIHRLRRFQVDLGRRLFTSLINPTDLKVALKTADVVIGCMRAPEGRTPCVVTEQMVSDMKFGSVIVDVSIDQGGVFETSEVTDHTKPVFKKYGVIHYCVPNIASRVSHTASIALSNIMAPIFIKMGDEGGFDSLIRKDKGLRDGVYVYNGMLTNKFFADNYNIPFRDLDLLLSAF